MGVGDKSGVYHVLDRATGGEDGWAAELDRGQPARRRLEIDAVADSTIFVASNRGGTTADLFALGMDDGTRCGGRCRWAGPSAAR